MSNIYAFNSNILIENQQNTEEDEIQCADHPDQEIPSFHP